MSHKQVHPRSIYRSPPSFKEMAIKYPKFRKFGIQELSGRMTIDFKNPEALQALTTTLLKKDFGLDVEIPLDRLVPTVPSRLNYVLWMEDLLGAAGNANSEVHGIDIGAGASCIYSLLAAKTKGWHMLATEVDLDNYKCAVENVSRNNLGNLIQVKHVGVEVVLKDVLLEGQQYDFCMCNPPFFSSEDELALEGKSRSPARPPPHGCRTGSPCDVLVPGGEVAFVSKIIQESKELGSTVRIYSSLLGHKSSLGPLKSLLQEVGVSSTVDAVFCHGRTSRWYVAWTFVADCDLCRATQHTGPSGKKKDKAPLSWVVPHPSDPAHYTLASVASRVKDMLQQLQISVRGLRSNDKIQSFQVTAFENSWSNQRKKRRAATLGDSPNKGNSSSDKNPGSEQQPSEDFSIVVKSDSVACDVKSAREETSGCSDASTDVFSVTTATGVVSATTATGGVSATMATGGVSEKYSSAVAQEKEGKRVGTDYETTEEHSVGHKRKLEEVISLSKKLKDNIQSCLLRACVVVAKNDNDILLEMTFVEGTGGREALHQVMQYFKNNLKL